MSLLQNGHRLLNNTFYKPMYLLVLQMSLNTSLAACMFTGLIHAVRFSAAANRTQFIFVNHYLNFLYLSDLANLFKHLIEYVDGGELLLS